MNWPRQGLHHCHRLPLARFGLRPRWSASLRSSDGLQTGRQVDTITDSDYMSACYWVPRQFTPRAALVVLRHFAQDIP